MNLAQPVFPFSERHVEVADVRLYCGKHYRGRVLSTAQEGSRFLATLIDLYEEDEGVWRKLDLASSVVGRVGFNWTLLPSSEMVDGVFLAREGHALVAVSVPLSLWEERGAYCFPEPVSIPELS